MIILDSIKNKEWFLHEKLFKYCPLALEPCFHSFEDVLEPYGMPSFSESLHEYDHGCVKIFFLKKDYQAVQQGMLERIIKNPEIMDKIHHDSDTVDIPEMKKVSSKILDQDLSAYNNKELLEIYNEMRDAQARLHTKRMIGWILEMQGEIFSEHLLDKIRKAITDNKLPVDPLVVFADLIMPDKPSVSTKAQEELYNMAKQQLVSDDEIDSYIRKYGFINYGTQGPLISKDQVLEQINDLQKKNIDDLIDQHKYRFENVKQKQAGLVKKLRLDEHVLHLINIARDISYQKSWGKEHQFLGFYALNVLMKEVGKRLSLSLKQALFLLPHEVAPALLENKFNADQLNERYKFSLLAIDDKGSRFILGGQAKDWLDQLNVEDQEEEVVDTNEITGQVAVTGQAKGKVVIINTLEEMKKMEDGAVLVSEMTIPEIIPAMKKASAIITDRGGIVCHAAIVSREFSIPCIIGTKIATKVLKDGDEVEVDAEAGVVRKL